MIAARRASLPAMVSGAASWPDTDPVASQFSTLNLPRAPCMRNAGSIRRRLFSERVARSCGLGRAGQRNKRRQRPRTERTLLFLPARKCHRCSPLPLLVCVHAGGRANKAARENGAKTPKLHTRYAARTASRMTRIQKTPSAATTDITHCAATTSGRAVRSSPQGD